MCLSALCTCMLCLHICISMYVCVCMCIYINLLVTGNTSFNILLSLPFSFTIYSSTPYLNLRFLSRVLIIHPQSALRRVLAQGAVNIRMLFCTNDLCTSRTKSICRVSGVLPTSRALFFGSWYDDDFIRRLLTNVATLKRHTEYLQSLGLHCHSSGFSGRSFPRLSSLPPF